METEYTNNSYKAREESAVKTEEPKKLEKVTSGETKIVKKITPKKIFETFFAEDVTTVKDYLIHDYLIPTIRDTVFNLFKNGLEMALYGETKPRKSNTVSGMAPIRVNYGGCFTNGRTETKKVSPRERSDFDPSDVIFENFADAEEVQLQIVEMISEFGMASLGDFCELAGVTGPYTANRYGWTSFGESKIKRIRDGGYCIEAPRPVVLPK